MSPSRKPHKKSRNGCNTCKQRRIKCDEAQPKCLNCLLRGRECTYSRPPSVDVSSPGGWSSSGTVIEHDQSYPRPGLPNGHGSLVSQRFNAGVQRLPELYLMHHYSTITYSTLANMNSSEEVDLWRNQIPREASKHEFLMDGILALSALHLASLEPAMSQVHTDTAIRYQNSGLYSFKIGLDCITDDNLHALFAFSVILVLLTMAAPAACPDESLLTPAERLMSLFKLLRGVGIINTTAAQTLRAGMFSMLLEPSGGPKPDSEVVCQDGLETALARLQQRADYLAKYVGRENHQVYVSSIESLGESFRLVVEHQSLGVVIAWPVMVNEELITLLRQGDPMAQLIWIYYGVLLLHVQSRWWGRDFGIDLITSLSDTVHAVDGEWATFTQWARDCAEAARTRQRSPM